MHALFSLFCDCFYCTCSYSILPVLLQLAAMATVFSICKGANRNAAVITRMSLARPGTGNYAVQIPRLGILRLPVRLTLCRMTLAEVIVAILPDMKQLITEAVAVLDSDSGFQGQGFCP